MIAAYERHGKGMLIWAVHETSSQASALAAKRATKYLGEKVSWMHFDTCEAKRNWSKKCGPDVSEWETILI